MDEINSILSQIQELNVAIRNSDIRGDEGLELRDQRNLLLDTLSQHMKIDVTYSMEMVGGAHGGEAHGQAGHRRQKHAH